MASVPSALKSERPYIVGGAAPVDEQEAARELPHLHLHGPKMHPSCSALQKLAGATEVFGPHFLARETSRRKRYQATHRKLLE